MIGYIYYFFFILLTFSPLLLLKYKKSGLLILYPLLFTAHFNATVFLKAGITISFFELTLMISVCVILSNAKKNKTLKGLLNAMCFYNQDKIWLNFLGFSFLSILISIYRVYLFRDIVPDPAFSPPFFIRGIMSLNKFFFYFPLFFVIRGYFKQHYDAVITHKTFIKALAFSGILPAVAIFVQFLGIGFSMIHNNPSFAETFRVETYQGARPAGLTNEASFFVYQLFFSTLGLYYAKLHGFIQLKKYYSILLLYILAVILSLSRTGLLIYGIFFLLVWFRKNSIFSLKGLKNITIAIPIIGLVLFALSRISIANFNLGSRFLSTFDQGADASTLERYGSADALYHLLIDKTIFLGVGIYNYQYYIKSYFIMRRVSRPLPLISFFKFLWNLD